MSTRRWTFDGLAFRMLLEQAGRDRLPFPLQVRPSADSAAHYHRQRHEAAISVADAMDADLRAAVHTIIEPVVRVEVVGHVRAGHTDHTKVRAHAAIGRERAVVLTQKPGVDDRSGGLVTAELIEPFRAVGSVLGVLPIAAKGSAPVIDVDVPHRGGDTPDLLLHQSIPRNSAEARYQRLFAQPPTAAGEILVAGGPAPDSRLTEGTTGVQWVDFADDGRYMIRHTTIISVVGISASELSAEIQGLVTRAIHAQ